MRNSKSSRTATRTSAKSSLSNPDKGGDIATCQVTLTSFQILRDLFTKQLVDTSFDADYLRFHQDDNADGFDNILNCPNKVEEISFSTKI